MPSLVILFIQSWQLVIFTSSNSMAWIIAKKFNNLQLKRSTIFKTINLPQLTQLRYFMLFAFCERFEMLNVE